MEPGHLSHTPSIAATCFELAALYPHPQPNVQGEAAELLAMHRVRQGVVTASLLLQHFYPAADGYRIRPLGTDPRDMKIDLYGGGQLMISTRRTAILCVDRLQDRFMAHAPPKPLRSLKSGLNISVAFRQHLTVLIIADDPSPRERWQVPNDVFQLIRVVLAQHMVIRGPAILFYGPVVEFLYLDEFAPGTEKILPFPFQLGEMGQLQLFMKEAEGRPIHYSPCSPPRLNLLDGMFRKFTAACVQFADGTIAQPLLPFRYRTWANPLSLHGSTEVTLTKHQEHAGKELPDVAPTSEASQTTTPLTGEYAEVLRLLAEYKPTPGVIRAPSVSPILEQRAD